MRVFLFYILLFVSVVAGAQTYEIGAFAGGTNNIGDVGRTNFILPSNYAVGGLFKWNKSKRYAWRGSVFYGKFKADDSKSNISSRQQRGYVVKNSILEASHLLLISIQDLPILDTITTILMPEDCKMV